MESLYYIFSWGSPVGLGMFFLLLGSGAGVFCRGLSHCIKSKESIDENG